MILQLGRVAAQEPAATDNDRSTSHPHSKVSTVRGHHVVQSTSFHNQNPIDRSYRKATGERTVTNKAAMAGVAGSGGSQVIDRKLY